MNRIYTVPGCASCKKAIQWMKNNELEYEEVSLYRALLENDGDQLIRDLEQLPLLLAGLQQQAPGDLAEFLRMNPSALPRPLLLLDTAEPGMLTGVRNACTPACSLYSTCLHTITQLPQESFIRICHPE